ncbi:MAG TPA: hypothetical protein VGG33_19080 [Polyangia bacterium]
MNHRRAFLQSTASATLATLVAPRWGFAAGTSNLRDASSVSNTARPSSGVGPLAQRLLTDWCDALVRLQIDDPARPREHGAFRCPACARIHGRCGDAVYPLLHMAKVTGQDKYRRAAIQVVDWMKNVDSPDGAFFNDPNDPKSWKGITVFGSIALAEALHWHGDQLEAVVKERWQARLRKAAAYVFETFTMDTGNINYPVTAAYALTLLGDLFDEPRYRERGRKFAHEAVKHFTTPSRLLFGEARPQHEKSRKGLLPVDLGYNVEESLPALSMYGLAARDQTVLDVVTTALAAHLEFLLPDGGWDNSWGTRNYKWTYWGSRTSDGCQPAYALLADRHPAFATAALRNTELLRACTAGGLLHGGPHYVAHGAPACVHHTFCHAKALATVLDHQRGAGTDNPRPPVVAPLPREVARGTRSIPELDVVLLAQGPWRATVSGYDRQYRKDLFSGTGGALSMLWHRELGPLLTASLTTEPKIEPNNLQTLAKTPTQTPTQEPWFCLTPRVELRVGDAWFSNVFDLGAKLQPGEGRCRVNARLLDAAGAEPSTGTVACELEYRLTATTAIITARVHAASTAAMGHALVLPVISPDGEKVRRLSNHRVAIAKPKGAVVVESTAPLEITEVGRERVFALMPGFAAVPFRIALTPGVPVTCTLRRAPRA